jgi:rod shape determining protein RodA
MSGRVSTEFENIHIRAFNLSNVRKVDPFLALVVMLLAVAGFMVLYSTIRSASLDTPYYLRQMMFFPIGCVIACAFLCTDYRFLISLGPVFYVALVGLLVGVSIWGVEAKGATRWLDFGLFRLQPSEQSKLALIFMLAWYFRTIGRKIEKLPYFLLTFAITAVPALLIFKQPNLGTAATLGPITIAMLFVAGCQRKHLVGIIILGIIASPFAWNQIEEYQKTRLTTFIDPSSDAKGEGYHTTQSMITVGSGGLSGKGYMEGTQTYLSYLPEHHTDFIFSLLAEEWGFIGSVTVIGLFALLFLRGLQYAHDSQDLAGALLAVGIVTLLAFHVFVNIAITLGIAPVTGIPLPFLSYGRSFYLTTMMCMGVLLSVNSRKGMFQD